MSGPQRQNKLDINLTDDEDALVQKAAEILGKTKRGWARNLILKRAEAIVRGYERPKYPPIELPTRKAWP